MAQPRALVEPRLWYFLFGAAGGAKSPGVEEGEIDVERAARLAPRSADDLLWIDVRGLGDGSVVRTLGEAFHVHRLAQADIVNLGQRPKADEYPEEDNLLLIVRMLSLDAGDRLAIEQMSILKGRDHVLTFQEREEDGDCLDPLRERIRGGKGRLVANGADYLAVQLLDVVVDGYFPVLEQLGSRLEQIEERILARPRTRHFEALHRIRRDLMTFRRSVWPLRDAVSHLLHEEELIGREAQVYLRDVADHVHQVVDVLETYREIASGLVDVYLSMLGHRTNEVMRVLTVVSSIFIPLTFLAGVYGMNFDTDVPGNMPELGWPFAYVGFWVVSIAAALALLGIFRRLGWLGGLRRRGERPD